MVTFKELLEMIKEIDAVGVKTLGLYIDKRGRIVDINGVVQDYKLTK